MSGSNGKLQDLTSRHVLLDRARACETKYREKSNIMANSMHKINADISMNDHDLKEVTGFKYLGATLCKDGTYSKQVSQY